MAQGAGEPRLGAKDKSSGATPALARQLTPQANGATDAASTRALFHISASPYVRAPTSLVTLPSSPRAAAPCRKAWGRLFFARSAGPSAGAFGLRFAAHAPLLVELARAGGAGPSLASGSNLGLSEVLP